jgi:co-chaperonin GroES (HSP10)
VVGAKDMKPHSCGHLPCPTCSGSGLAEGVMAIPDASQQDHSYGDILVAGSQIHDLQAGDRVVFSKMAGIWIRGDEQKLILMRRGEVMGLMTK